MGRSASGVPALDGVGESEACRPGDVSRDQLQSTLEKAIELAVDAMRDGAGDAALLPQSRRLHRFDARDSLLLTVSFPVCIIITKGGGSSLRASMSSILIHSGGVNCSCGQRRVADELEELVRLLTKDLGRATKRMALRQSSAISPRRRPAGGEAQRTG